MANFTLKANTQENRLYITISGVWTMDDNERYRKVLKDECAKLKRGFSVLQDIREFSVVDPAIMKEAEGNKKVAEDAGMGKNAMVVQSAILKGQMNRTFNQKQETKDAFFDSIEAALKYLNS